MKLCRILFLLSVLAVCVSKLSATYASLKSTFYRKLLLDDVVVTQDVISDVTVISEMDCARACVNAEGCVMFTSLPNPTNPSGRCQLYRQKPSSTMGQEDSPGARNYALHDPCDQGYSWTCGRCMMMVTTSKTFTNARQHCRGLDQGRLMVIKTLEEMHCAMDLMVLNDLTNHQAWVGADDLAEEGRYVCEDGTLLPIDSAVWASQQPTNHDATEDCIALFTSHSQGLHDDLCHYTFPFICEKTHV